MEIRYGEPSGGKSWCEKQESRILDLIQELTRQGLRIVEVPPNTKEIELKEGAHSCWTVMEPVSAEYIYDEQKNHLFASLRWPKGDLNKQEKRLLKFKEEFSKYFREGLPTKDEGAEADVEEVQPQEEPEKDEQWWQR